MLETYTHGYLCEREYSKEKPKHIAKEEEAAAVAERRAQPVSEDEELEQTGVVNACVVQQ